MVLLKSNTKENLSGNKYHKLLVLEHLGRTPVGSQYKQIYRCLCDCGKGVLTNSNALKSGNTQSCGCHKRSLVFKHGMSQTRMFSIWTNMFERCYKPKNPNYKRYGGRGITICDRWNVFLNFYEDMKDGYADNLSIDRIDVNGNYEKSNCRWATCKEQSNNRRDTIYLTVDGETKIIEEWAKVSPVKLNTIRSRVWWGWNDKDAIFRPLSKGVNHAGAKLKESDVIYIFTHKDTPVQELADKFGVNIGVIEGVRYGKNYTKITEKLKTNKGFIALINQKNKTAIII